MGGQFSNGFSGRALGARMYCKIQEVGIEMEKEIEMGIEMEIEIKIDIERDKDRYMEVEV